jgi:SAM-dependent methyltransferase
MTKKAQNTWQKHYTREKSILSYPDENLVRLISKSNSKLTRFKNKKVLDLGCGSGRHISLLTQCGFEAVGLDLASLTFLIARLKPLSKSEKSSQKKPPFLIQGSGLFLPFKPSSFQAVIAWGSLHYGSFEHCRRIINGVHSVLEKNGVFWGTLRSMRDTYLKRGKKIGKNQWEIIEGDIGGAEVTYFSEKNLPLLLGQFSSFQYGFMERTPLAEPKRKISHIFFEAWK